MKIVAFLIFSSLWLIHVRVSNADYRFRRMPPPPPRAPQYPQFAKKYHNPYVRQSRPPRPIPIQMNPQYKKPIGPPMVIIPQRPIPVRPPPPNPVKLTVAWAAPNYPNNRPVVKQLEPKPFVSSPTIQTEYDFHVQTNQIPSHIPKAPAIPNNLFQTHSNIIQMTDDKGPIHTIPAPNLSLADKPAHLEIIPPKQQTTSTTTTVEILKSQQYQVTETPEHLKKIYRQQTYTPEVVTPKEQPEIMLTSNEQVNQLSQQDLYKILQNYPPLNTLGLLQQPPLEQQPLGLETLQYYQAEPTFLVQQTQEPSQQQPHVEQQNYQLEQQQNHQLEQQQNHQLEQQQTHHLELPQSHDLLNSYREQQPRNRYQVQQEQSHHHEQQQQRNRHNEPQQEQHIPEQPHHHHSHQQKEIKPEYHTFNYVEPAIKSSKTEYKIEHPSPASESQTQFLQNYYEQQQPVQTINANTIPDFQNYELPELKEDYGGNFYSSLPSKEAAQSLASLQEAGKQNTQKEVVESASSKRPMTIYVPDDGEGDGDKYKRDSEGAGTGVYDYEEAGLQEDELDEVQNEEFGSRIRPKM